MQIVHATVRVANRKQMPKRSVYGVQWMLMIYQRTTEWTTTKERKLDSALATKEVKGGGAVSQRL